MTMGMDDKLLTIVIPSYNMEKYIVRTCSSLVVPSELMERLEVLIINDGSTDRTSELGHVIARRYPETFRVIDKPNGHYGSCVNCGLASANGKFIKILDCDDTFKVGQLEKFIKFLAEGEKLFQNGEVDLIVTDFNIVSDATLIEVPGNNLIVERKKWHSDCPLDLRPHTIDDFLPMAERFDHYAITYRTEMLRQYKYRQTEGCAYTDLEWIFIPMCSVRNIVYWPYFLYQYSCDRAGRSTELDTWYKTISVRFHIVRKNLEEFKKKIGDMPEYKKSFLRRLIIRRVSEFYFAGLIAGNRDLSGKKLKNLDKEIGDIDEGLYNDVGELTFTNQHVRMVYLWRKSKLLAMLIGKIIKLYIKAKKYAQEILKGKFNS